MLQPSLEKAVFRPEKRILAFHPQRSRPPCPWADDACLGGERAGRPGRGSPNKVPFVAAVSLNGDGHPIYAKMAPLPGFTRKAVAAWAGADLAPGCVVHSGGLSCFAAVADAGCEHRPTVAGGRKP